MREGAASYWTATRHPLASLVFVLPLLLFYEFGLYQLETRPAEELRNGADAWLRGVLQQVGISPIYGAPILLLGVLLLWTLARSAERPRDLLGLWIGMIIESAAFALGLVCLSQILFPIMQAAGGLLHGPTVRLLTLETTANPLWEQLIGYVGAGVYEEALFRLLLFSGLVTVLLSVECPRGWALTISALVASLLFAAAHNVGAFGEPFRLVVFIFRTIAGLYFTWIHQVRGFGIAVGAHAGYDVVVGLYLRSA